MHPDIDTLWDFGDPAATEVKFRALLPELAGDRAAKAELLTQIARTFSLRRAFETAHELLDEAEALMTSGDSRERVRLLLERGRSHNSAGDKKAARPIFQEAWEMARRVGTDGLAVDAAHMIAIVETEEGALAWNDKALALAESSSDPKARKWKASLYNNLGWTHHSHGRFGEALSLFEKALAEREVNGQATETRIARWCVARALRSLERYEEALAIQEALRSEIEREALPADGFVHEELAELLHALGRGGVAEQAHRAHALLSQDEWFVANEAARMRRLEGLMASADDPASRSPS